MTTLTRNPIIDGQPAPPLLVIISGPSGVGKDEMLVRMRAGGIPFHLIVTATSRPRRPGEIDGQHYHFVTRARFEQMIASGDLLEWAEVYGQYKGIPRWEVRRALASGADVILRIDVQGARTVRALAPGVVSIFLIPGSMDELRERLASRQTESASDLERRLATAAREMTELPLFDYVVVNRQHRQDDAVETIRAIILAEKHRVVPRTIQL